MENFVQRPPRVRAEQFDGTSESAESIQSVLPWVHYSLDYSSLGGVSLHFTLISPSMKVSLRTKDWIVVYDVDFKVETYSDRAFHERFSRVEEKEETE